LTSDNEQNCCDERRWSQKNKIVKKKLELSFMLIILKKRWVYHTLTWFVILIIMSLVDDDEPNQGNFFDVLTSMFISFLPNILVLYSFFFLKNKYFKNQRYKEFIIYCLLLMVIGVLISNIESLFGWEKFEILNSIISLLMFVLISLGVQYMRRAIVNQYYFKEIEAKHKEAELYIKEMEVELSNYEFERIHKS